MIDLEKIICFRLFDGDSEYLSEVSELVDIYRKAGYSDDKIFDFFFDDYSTPDILLESNFL